MTTQTGDPGPTTDGQCVMHVTVNGAAPVDELQPSSAADGMGHGRSDGSLGAAADQWSQCITLAVALLGSGAYAAAACWPPCQVCCADLELAPPTQGGPEGARSDLGD